MTHEAPHIPDDAEQAARSTPVMRQYWEIKKKHPDTILFFRIGDFYETFERDAELISRELEIVLTSRSKSGENQIPLRECPIMRRTGILPNWSVRDTRLLSSIRWAIQKLPKVW